MSWPDWWSWELELTPHVEKRLEDRSFTETDLRSMLQRATGHRLDHVEGRFLVETRHAGAAWHVIVEPDDEAQLPVVVTCYPSGRP